LPLRFKGATAGVVITASHNPPHDNGFKCLLRRRRPSRGTARERNRLPRERAGSDAYQPLPKSKQGKLITLGKEIDEAYMDRLETLVLDRPMVKSARASRLSSPASTAPAA
jgi:phosphoglucomutase